MNYPVFLSLVAWLVCGSINLHAQAVTSFTLIDAHTDTEIGLLNDGDEINLRSTGSALNVRANTSGTVGSVRFWLDGEQKNTESAAPYAMTGDNAGDYNIWTPSLGLHTVEAIPYTESGAGGIAGTSLSVNFTVISTDEPIVHPTDSGTGTVTLRGALRKWHKITLSFDGPAYKEKSLDPNPFLDYRLEVTFTNGNHRYKVPGYFAVDGNAAETSADSGNIWRVHFAPDTIGTWNYEASFFIGRNIAVTDTADDMASIPPIHGKTGSFVVEDTDKTGRDNRAKGRLQYVGEHFLRYAQSGEYFIKGGADAPENFLAYNGFDGEFKSDGIKDDLIKSWSGHIDDWQPGDPVWQGDKGKGIIGAVNYLASEDLNVFSFLTMNINGDDRNVYPYINYSDYKHFDCSKLDQWEMVFTHADSLGMYLHFKTQETENDQLLDGGELGIDRMLYYRELIARFGHHLALNWNLGEENTQTVGQRRDMAKFFFENDPYHHHVVLHTFPGQIDEVYSDLVGDQSKYSGISIQTGWNSVYSNTVQWVTESAKTGRKWVVANDEQGSANIGVPEDEYTGTPNKDDIRKQVLWGNYMAGGAGVEYYFGYQRPHSDLTCQDYRSRDISWDYVRYAKNFFSDTIKFWQMKAMNELSSSGWTLANEGEMILTYLPNGGSAEVTLRDRCNYQVRWFDPRNGGALQQGSVTSITGRGKHNFGTPPDHSTLDWAVLISRQQGEAIPVANIQANTHQGQIPLVVQFDASASIGNQAIVDYYWDFGDGTTALGAVVEHNFTKVGEYSVALVVENEKGEVDYAYLTVIAEDYLDIPLGHTSINKVEIFPNPAKNQVFISNIEGKVSIFLMNQLGQILATKQTSESQSSIDLDGLSSGMYLVFIRGANGSSTIKKLLIEN